MSAADLASFNLWSSVYEVLAWLVALGVLMEGSEIWVRRASQRQIERFGGPSQQVIPEPEMPHWAHNVGDIGFVMLVAALIIEPICHAKIEAITGRENRRLNSELALATKNSGEAIKQAGDAIKDASLANERSKQLESTNLVLRAEVARLELKIKHRIISQKQIKDFIFLSENLPKIPVRIDVGNGVFNEETCNYAFEIRKLLIEAKYTIPASDQSYSMGIFNDPTRTYLSTVPATDLVLFTAAGYLPTPQFEDVNGLKRPIYDSKITNSVYACLYYAFENSGISIGWNCKPEWVGENHLEIFVRQKP